MPLPKIDHLIAYRFGIKLHSHGILHPGIGHQDPESRDGSPRKTSHVESRWVFLLTLFHPKNMIEMNVASRKNAMIPSIARGAPKISPTNQL